MIKACLIGLLVITSFANANTDQNTLETIVITGSNPLSKLSDTQSIIGQTQILTSDQLHRLPSRSLAEIMRNQLVSVNINDVQNNPFQPDVQYRGFTASPLLGLPQGLSIYLNGTRVNEPFGDTVNWDLLPLEALDNVLLFSTSNPVFGQNTLGGALVLNTKNGFSYEETAIDISVGQYGRKEWSLQSGMNQGNWGLYVLANQYQEDGWRDFSPSEVNQFFSTLSHHTSDSQIDLTWLYVDNELLGNGAIPEALLEFEPRSAVYTHPDQTNNELNFITLNINTSLNNSLKLIVNAFYRDNETQSINGDDSDYGACEFAQGLITLCDLEDDNEPQAVNFVGYEGVAFSQISDIDADEVDGTYNTGRARNESRGMTAQLSQPFKLGTLPSQTIYGVGAIRAGINYKADSTFGILANDTADDTRVVVPLTGILDDEARVRLDVDTTTAFAYVSNVTELSAAMTLNIAARYNRDHILMRDLIDQGEGSLNGDHRFTSFNPAIGLTYAISDVSNFNLSYAQATRVPSPAELSCADEDDPCRLPNGFVADPPLNKVVTRTLEASFVGSLDTLSYNATVFHSQSVDDIIFQQAGTTSSRGYFINIDKTQRLGVELSVSRQFDKWSTSASYNYLDATFESGFTSFSPMNPLGPNRQVSAGDTIPGQPQHQLKLRGIYYYSDSWNMGAQFIYASKQYYRGDEANENKQIGAYSLVNIFSEYIVNDRLTFALRVDNLFDSDYDTFGTYGEADEVLEDIYPSIDSPYFIGVGHPRTVSINVQYKFKSSS
ncbi:TonB-dependent receptor [Glaciecola sp. 33A]|jgi:iron complex outermembrane receptor protein|uniref:TonB-dependent receptor n=1 Tax=Glaciecola sp. 33A TaxID=2057807 RepID=UPI000C31C321|nr:TonB-dependent receptor [Glaciecola sp. 33A]PKI01259.1 TonB-dependent receptor [Glaciecola sp. 33A]